MSAATRSQPAPGEREHPSTYSAEQLRKMLVEDAVLNHATELRWFTAAIVRIGGGTGVGAELAMNALLDEVETLTGRRQLPMHSGVIS